MGSGISSSDFDLYTKRIKDYALLTPEEELDLSRRYRMGDVLAGQRIVTSNLRFVVKISQSYFHLGYGPLEIVQEGNMGLVKALTRFDPDMGVRFICYAIWWIKAYIKNFIHKSYQVHTGRLTHAKGLLSLNSSLSQDNENKEECLLDHLHYEGPDQDDCYAKKERRAYLLQLLSSDPPILSKREALIIRKRFFSDPPHTLKDIAMEIGITRERVRQIEMRSLKRIRDFMEKNRELMAVDIHTENNYPMRKRKI